MKMCLPTLTAKCGKNKPHGLCRFGSVACGGSRFCGATFTVQRASVNCRFPLRIVISGVFMLFASRVSAALSGALLLLSINACSQDSGSGLSAPEAYAQVQAKKLTLIDIRRPEEWRQTGVAQDALRINMIQPQGEAGFVQQVSTAVGGDKNAPIGLICRTGNRTTKMQAALREAGFTQVFNIKEGMAGSGAGPGWIARGLPVTPCPHC
jgi:rhodanese-related sulfurtransferase